MNKSRLQYAIGFIGERLATPYPNASTYALVILEADAVWRKSHEGGFLLGKGSHEEYCSYLYNACAAEAPNARWKTHLDRGELDCLELAYGKRAGLVNSLNFSGFLGGVLFVRNRFPVVSDAEVVDILCDADASFSAREGIPLFGMGRLRAGVRYCFLEAMEILRENPECIAWAHRVDRIQEGRIEWAVNRFCKMKGEVNHA